MDRQLTLLVKLIDDLLEISRISTGRIVLRRERLDLRNVVRTAVESCQPVVEAAKHRLTVEMPDRAVWVRGDSSRLAQALSNLINNAAKYTPSDGNIHVALRLAGGEALLTVADDGLGIPPEMLDRVFQMFTQVNRTLDRSQGGLGIGLALVRNLIQLHGGKVTAHSEGENRGSVSRSSCPPARQRPRTKGRCPARALMPELLDRCASWWSTTTSMPPTRWPCCSGSGHRTHVAYSGTEALKAATEFRPEAIFCDIGMAGMGGTEVAARLREDTRFATTVMVALTGWGTEDDIRRTHESGFDFHLTKPASSENVQRILSQL